MSYTLKVNLEIEAEPKEEDSRYGETLAKFSIDYKNKDYAALKASFLNLMNAADETEID